MVDFCNNMMGAAPELDLLIMQQLDSVADLENMVFTSPVSSEIFTKYRKSMLARFTRGIHKKIHPGALNDAIAAVLVPTTANTTELLQLVQLWKTQSHFGEEGKYTIEEHMPLRQLVELERLADTVNRFVDDYSYKATRDPFSEHRVYNKAPEWSAEDLTDERSQNMHMTPPTLTDMERLRFQRAYFRLELYCRVYRRQDDPRRQSWFTGISAERQVIYTLAPAEVEELGCAYWHIFSLVRIVFDHMAIKEEPVLNDESRKWRKLPQRNWEHSMRDDYVRSLCGNGLGFVEDLLRAPYPRRRATMMDLFQVVAHLSHNTADKEFLRHSLIGDAARVNQGRWLPVGDRSDSHDSVKPNQLWLRHRNSSARHRRAVGNDIDCFLYSAYIMWDNETLNFMGLGSQADLDSLLDEGWYPNLEQPTQGGVPETCYVFRTL